MSGTSTAVSVAADEQTKIVGEARAVPGAMMVDKMGKKRTAREAGLDDGATEGVKAGEGREWVLSKVEEMERAFKDACYYRSLIIRFHVEARYHNLQYIQPHAPQYMIDRYRKACVTWQDTKSLVQAYLEEAARNYVPPPPKKTEPTPSAPTETLKPAATTTTTAHTNGKPMPAPLALVTSTNTASKSPAYIDPKTGLPSPTQPTIHLVDDSNVIGDVDSSRVVTGNTTTGKSPRTGGSVKKSPRQSDPPNSASLSASNSNNNHLDSNHSANTAKFPTGSAGDPIEIDDLDADVQPGSGNGNGNSGGGQDVDMDGDIVHLVDGPPLAVQGTLENGNTKTNGQPSFAGVRDPANAMSTATVQPEGIGLGLGLGLAGLGLSGLGLAGFSDTSGTGELPAEVYGLQGTSNMVGVGSNDTSGTAFGVDGIPAAGAGGEAGAAGEQQISEEDLMRFFESLAPGSGGGAGDGVSADALQALEGGLAGNTGGDGFLNVAGEQNFGSTDVVGDTAGAVNALAEATGGEAGTSQPQQADAGGMPEELDLSNLDWTQYSALLADIPDDLGGGGA